MAHASHGTGTPPCGETWGGAKVGCPSGECLNRDRSPFRGEGRKTKSLQRPPGTPGLFHVFSMTFSMIFISLTGSLRRLMAAVDRRYQRCSASETVLLTFGARSRTVGGVWRCSWALGLSTRGVRDAGTIGSDPRANPFEYDAKTMFLYFPQM